MTRTIWNRITRAILLLTISLPMLANAEDVKEKPKDKVEHSAAEKAANQCLSC